MESEGQILALPFDLNAVHIPHRGLLHPGVHAEIPKVVLPLQKLRRLAHLPKVGPLVQPDAVFPVKDRLHRPVLAGVPVGLARGVVPGVEPVRGLPDLPHRDVVRQIAVHVIPNLLAAHFRVHPGVGHHALRVDPGIGAPCPDDLRLLAAHQAQHMLQLPLDGVLLRLALPPKVTAPVVFQQKFKVLHLSSPVLKNMSSIW